MGKITHFFLVACFFLPSAHANTLEEKLQKAYVGDVNVQFELGKIYETGIGAPINYKHAYIWYSMAASQGHKQAFQKRNKIEKKLTPQQLFDAQEYTLSLQQRMIDFKKKEAERKANRTRPIINQRSVKGRFLTNSLVGNVFIITGQVENTTVKPINQIKIHGLLITEKNFDNRSQTVYCGMIYSDEQLKNQDINKIYKKLEKNDSNIVLAPGESDNFMIIFSNLPEALTEYKVSISDFKIVDKN